MKDFNFGLIPRSCRRSENRRSRNCKNWKIIIIGTIICSVWFDFARPSKFQYRSIDRSLEKFINGLGSCTVYVKCIAAYDLWARKGQLTYSALFGFVPRIAPLRRVHHAYLWHITPTINLNRLTCLRSASTSFGLIASKDCVTAPGRPVFED